MSNGIRKIFVINLVVLLSVGKILQFYFNKLDNGIRILDIKIPEHNCTIQQYDHNELKQFYNTYKNRTNLASLRNFLEESNNCEYINKTILINRHSMQSKSSKLKIFITILLIVILLNYIAIKYVLNKNKKQANDKLSDVYKTHGIKREIQPYIVTNNKKQD